MGSKGKVIIIGGGIAGIKAALELNKHGIGYFILEAKDRLGGRLKTVEGLNTKYDMGASWFHDTLSNPLFDTENSLPVGERAQFYYDDIPHKTFDQNGTVPADSRLEPIAAEISKYIEMENLRDLDADKSVYETVIKYFQEKKHLLSKRQIEHALGYIRKLELWHGISINELSSKYSEVENNGRNALVKNYDTILNRHVAQLSKDSYKLNTAVKSITRTSKNKKVKVTTVDGEEYEGDFAIVAVPQSMIALGEQEMGAIKFEPKLPQRITESLKKCHFGALGKVVLEFDECFWGTDDERFVCLSSPPEGFAEAILDDKTVPNFPNSETPKPFDYPVLFLNFAADFNKPSLVAITQSPLTDYLEENPEKAWKFLKPYVQVISSKKDIPDPKNVFTSEWTTDPYQRGSYSACFPGDDPISAVVAFEEGFGNVRFAGEHTIMDGNGCVHGAWMSGLREATYIIDHLE
ncbi:unnamed protein product [Wickerhamomyces anomalus]